MEDSLRKVILSNIDRLQNELIDLQTNNNIEYQMNLEDINLKKCELSVYKKINQICLKRKRY